MFRKMLKTDDAGTTLLIRLMVGTVFLSEGIQKFLFVDTLGAGRFAKIGIPNPDFFAPFVGTFEIICGSLVLIGLYTRLAAIPLFIIILVAISSTKAGLLVNNGFWSMLHDSRTDWCMLLGCIFLNLKGSGRYSIDRKISQL